MAKVTLVIEDKTIDGKRAINIYGDFDEPGRSLEEMTTNPTYAVATGLAMIEVAKMMADSFDGKMEDEFGTVVEIKG